jgi:uncharacterized protein DUF6875
MASDIAPAIELKPSDVRLAARVLDWLTNHIAQPHPEIRRRGPMCPFVGPAVAHDELTIVVQRGVDGSDAAELERVVRGRIDTYRAERPIDPRSEKHHAVVLVLPDVVSSQTAALDAVHAAVKNELMEHGVMLGQFHSTCDVPAARNPDFPVQRADIPCFALRPMTLHDILFIHDDDFRFAQYRKIFGEEFESGRVTDRLLVDRYREAERRLDIDGRSSSARAPETRLAAVTGGDR